MLVQIKVVDESIRAEFACRNLNLLTFCDILNPIQSFFFKYEQSLCAFYLEVSQIHANVTDGLIMKHVLQPELRHFVFASSY